MAVRLRLRISVGEVSVEAVALLSSGYEAPTPQLLIQLIWPLGWGFGPLNRPLR